MPCFTFHKKMISPDGFENSQVYTRKYPWKINRYKMNRVRKETLFNGLECTFVLDYFT